MNFREVGVGGCLLKISHLKLEPENDKSGPGLLETQEFKVNHWMEAGACGMLRSPACCLQVFA